MKKHLSHAFWGISYYPVYFTPAKICKSAIEIVSGAERPLVHRAKIADKMVQFIHGSVYTSEHIMTISLCSASSTLISENLFTTEVKPCQLQITSCGFRSCNWTNLNLCSMTGWSDWYFAMMRLYHERVPEENPNSTTSRYGNNVKVTNILFMISKRVTEMIRRSTNWGARN